MFSDYYVYPWVRSVYDYASSDQLLAALEEKVIAPAVADVMELRDKRHSGAE